MAFTLLRRGHWLPLALALTVSVVTAAVLVHVDTIERERRHQEARATLAAQISAVRAKLEFSLSEPLARAQGVIAHIVAHDGISAEQFHTIGEVLLKDQRGVRNMVVSHGLVIAMSYPLAGNESVIGIDYRSIPVQYEQVRKAMDSRAPLLQGPVPLIQGGIGLILRNPVFLHDGRFYGMANIVLDIPAIFAEAGLSKPDLPFQIAIRGGDGLGAAGVMILGDQAVFAAQPVLTDVVLTQGTWQLAAIPKDGWDVADAIPVRVRLMEVLAFVAMTAIAFGAAFHIIGQDQGKEILRRKSLELERSNADLERFAYIASHDLQTPLRNVISYAQLLARRYGGRLDQDADDFIGFIVEGSARMSQLIQDLLNYARLSNSVEPLAVVDAGQALQQALANLAGVVEHSHTTVEAGDLPMVRANPAQLVSLFQNLVDNAIKYADPSRPPHIRITARSDQSGWWTIAVADNGIGIAAEYFEQIFVVFQRLHTPGDRSGTGIGLAICQRIVQHCGGRIWVESSPGQGATFLFTLAAAETGLSS